MKLLKIALPVVFISALTSFLTVQFLQKDTYWEGSFRFARTMTTGATEVYTADETPTLQQQENSNVFLGGGSSSKYYAAPDNFIRAAQITTPAVVHIKTDMSSSGGTWRGSLGDRLNEMMGKTNPTATVPTGSGVIISSDGYIVTNRHVVADSKTIEVILNNRKSYLAALIAQDPATDLALLKVNAYDLPALKYGDSDSLQVGEWVLAVGNPFNLTSTVTAGIVSAKGRNINIVQTKDGIESFIQTDAAVNPGNSGGALVNTAGQLVGINTAIATASGTFSGYSFAVPINIVRKVVDDFKKFGVVQSAKMGMQTVDITGDLAQMYKLKSTAGVLVQSVAEGSAAFDAGLKKGDVITEINGGTVNSQAELQERIARYSPGDAIAVSYLREGAMRFAQVTLKNDRQTTDIVRTPKEGLLAVLGGEFRDVPIGDLQRLGLRNGLKLVKLVPGLLRDATPIKVGFIVEKADGKFVFSQEDFYNIIKVLKSGDTLKLEGWYDGERMKKVYSVKIP